MAKRKQRYGGGLAKASKETRVRVARMGAQAIQARGTAYQLSGEKARIAGRKGAKATNAKHSGHVLTEEQWRKVQEASWRSRKKKKPFPGSESPELAKRLL